MTALYRLSNAAVVNKNESFGLSEQVAVIEVSAAYLTVQKFTGRALHLSVL